MVVPTKKMSLPMTDGVDATFTKGSFLVYHEGVAYLNFDTSTCEPFVFSATALGKLIDSESIEVEEGKNHPKRKYVLKKASVIRMMVDNGSEAVYMEGSFELTYDEDVFYLLSECPVFNEGCDNIKCSLRNDTLKVTFNYGRHVASYEFQKKSDDSSRKRKRLNSEAEGKHAQAKKRMEVLENHVSTTFQVAKKSLLSIQELIDLEETMRNEAGVENEMLEDMQALQAAKSMLSRMIFSLE